MESLKNYYETHKKQIMLIIVLILVSIVTCISFIKIEKRFKNKNDKEIVASLVEKKSDESTELKDPKVQEVNTIKVDVKGFVVNEGVYSLESDARVIDALLAAGGLKEGAYTRYLNLSKKLNDEDVIIVNNFEEVEKMKEKPIETKKEEVYCETINKACLTEEKIITSTPVEEKQISNDNIQEKSTDTLDKPLETKEKDASPELNPLVNINTATKEELMTLNGIGESKAEKIIEYRSIHGEFKTIDEIKNVSGIGDSVYDKIKEFIKVE